MALLILVKITLVCSVVAIKAAHVFQHGEGGSEGAGRLTRGHLTLVATSLLRLNFLKNSIIYNEKEKGKKHFSQI